MKNVLKLSFCITPFLLTGCAEMLQASQNARESLQNILGNSTTNPNVQAEAINDTPSKICKVYQENPVQALTYQGKKISFKSRADSISEAGMAGVFFKVGTASIAYFSDYKTISTLKKGNVYNATGIIQDIGLETNTDMRAKCRIIVKGNSIH